MRARVLARGGLRIRLDDWRRRGRGGHELAKLPPSAAVAGGECVGGRLEGRQPLLRVLLVESVQSGRPLS